MKPIKLCIQKHHEFKTSRGIWKKFLEVEKIIIDDYSPIKTEAQLCDYIFRRHGEGRFMVLAWQKGIEGFWCFWLGFLMPNGFIRDLKKNKELDLLKQELNNADSYEEREEIENEMDFEREISNASKGMTRRGPIGLIKFHPGALHGYEELPQERRLQREPEVNEYA